MEAIERSVTVERKNDGFLDLYERLKALNSPLKNEREFEPHHRSSSTKTMTDNWHINNNRKDQTDLQTLKTTDIKLLNIFISPPFEILNKLFHRPHTDMHLQITQSIPILLCY